MLLCTCPMTAFITQPSRIVIPSSAPPAASGVHPSSCHAGLLPWPYPVNRWNKMFMQLYENIVDEMNTTATYNYQIFALTETDFGTDILSLNMDHAKQPPAMRWHWGCAERIGTGETEYTREGGYFPFWQSVTRTVTDKTRATSAGTHTNDVEWIGNYRVQLFTPSRFAVL